MSSQTVTAVTPTPLLSTITQSWGAGSLNHSPHFSSLLCLYWIQQTPSSVTLLLEPHTLLSQLPSDVRCIIASTPCQISVSMPLSSWSLRALSGQGTTKVFGCGPEHVYIVSAPRCIDMLSYLYQPLPALTFALTTSTLILLDLSLPPEDTPICSPALSTSLIGLKPSLSQISQLKPSPEPPSLVGLLTLVSLQPCPQTEDTSFSLNSSLIWCSSSICTTAYHPIANGLVECLHH